MAQGQQPISFRGGCLCGAVRFESRAAAQLVGHCYCTDCRRSSGTAHSTHVAVPEAALTITGEPTFYDRAADSGNLVSRGFCGTCGSPLLSRNAAMPGMVFVRASALDDPEIARPQMIVYASRAPSWDRPDPTLPAFATMPEGGAGEAVRRSGGPR
ncbi:GFA family protein [Albidovulum sediminis]|uniref:GFA family protein n=1 Tax=Albidovulum sediminis TaxID=3066345 RepID=A0ABT2NIZ4_9RHOB|nr:GFA family protein [Defluviimonas sediminis]MCT8328901.1 GFA family protein [Defluviimonas sediminis]